MNKIIRKIFKKNILLIKNDPKEWDCHDNQEIFLKKNKIIEMLEIYF